MLKELINFRCFAWGIEMLELWGSYRNVSIKTSDVNSALVPICKVLLKEVSRRVLELLSLEIMQAPKLH
jgi:hypothetical protein